MTRTVLLATCVALGSSAAAAQTPAPSHTVVPPTRKAPREVARVNDVVLTSDRLEAAVNALIPLESFHQTVGDAKVAELRKQALQQIIDEELEYQDGVKLGIVVAKRDVEAALAATVARHGGRARFEEALARAGASTASARRELTRALVIARTRDRRVAATCQVGEADVARYFNENPGRFVEPEQLHVHAITIGVDPSSTQAQWQAARTKSESLREQLQAGASFDDLARQHSTDPTRAKGGDMGLFHRGSLTPQFEAVAGDLPIGGVSGVIETLYGYHLIRISDIRPARRMTLTEVSERLEKDLTDARCKEGSDAWLSRLRSTSRIALD